MSGWKSLRLSLLSIGAALLVWVAVTEGGLVDRKFLPSPADIAQQGVLLAKEGYIGTPLYEHVLASLLRTFVGFICGAVLAVPLGLSLGYSDRVYAIVSPFLSALRPIPVIAYIPLVILWFGIGEFSKILLIALTAFLYITVNAAAGVRSISIDLIRASQSLGVTNRQLFMHVILPGSLPYIFTGLKVGAAISWAVVVAAELVAAQRGLGYMIMDAATFFRIPTVYVGIVLIGVIGFGIERAIAVLERRLVHWSNR
jgi:NitT/TauT family transport system permease protein